MVPVFLIDSGERWRPVPVEMILRVGARIDGESLTSLDQLNADSHRLDFPSRMRQPLVTPAVYHRALFAGGLWWHQYWHFWLYNPKEYVGFGAHEGDWEMVQLGCVDLEGDRPVLMTCSQHKAGEKREFWRVELDGGRPKVYVAAGSHAGYFTIHHDLTDDADGRVQINPHVLAFGAWAVWGGRWGNSDSSPGSLPSHQAWQAPHIFHGQARG